MFKLFHKKLNKKGFTLAELLVVVAIVAILVAIAIPIFTSATRQAEEAVKTANIRSVKAAAVTEILSNWSKYGDRKGKGGVSATAWYATATVESATSNIVDLKIATGEEAAVKAKKDGATRESSGNYTVGVAIGSLSTSESAPGISS